MRPNFYQLLELDPEIDDWRAIESRLRSRQKEWARDRSGGNPKQRREAARALELLVEMEATLQDPATRQAEAQAEKQRRRREVEERSRELDEAIDILRAAGACREEDVERLVQRFSGAFSDREVRKKLRSAGVETGRRAECQRRKLIAERLDESVARRLRTNLAQTGHETLYEFLGLRPQSSPEALVARAGEIDRENRRVGKTDAVTSAANALAGEAKVLFADLESQARYDAHLAVEAMEGLKPNIALAAQDGYITKGELDALVRQAMKRGVSAENARAWIEEMADRQRVGIERAAELPAEALRQCGFCGHLVSSPKAKQCSACGEPLEIECPRCGEDNPSQNAACESCGARVGDAPLVLGHLARARHLLDRGDFAQADARLRQALHLWPDWNSATELLAKVEARRSERESQLEAIETKLCARQLFAARSELDRLERRLGGDGLERLRKRIESGIAEAQELFAQGEEHRRAGRLDPAIDLFERVLGLAADHRAARSAMASSPPAAPTHLDVRPLPAGFRLSWKPGSERGTPEYRVVRKAGAAPRDASDGETVAEGLEPRLDDSPVAVGKAWHYAVFAVRGGVASTSGVRSGPHLRTAEVAEVVATAGDKEVVIAFEPPPGSLRVEVRGGDVAPPRRAGEGRRLGVSGNIARDLGLTNGRRHGYRLVAVFADPARPGGEIATLGVTVEAVPSEPPPPVSDLVVERRGRHALVSWSPIPRARVEVRWDHEPPSLRPGEVLTAEVVGRFGQPVPGTGPGKARLELAAQGRLVFVPFTVRDGVVVAGEPRELVTLEPVCDLAARRSGRTVLLTWTWPDGGTQALVRWDTRRPPTDPRSGDGGRLRVERSVYERDGGVRLEALGEQTHHVAVFARAPQGDLYAPPATVVVEMGTAAAVAYAVQVRRKLFGRRIADVWVELESDGGGRPDMPPLRLVGKARGVPVHAGDGKLLGRVDRVDFQDGRGRIPIPERHWASGLYCKLFFDDPSQGAGIRLLPAARERLRIG